MGRWIIAAIVAVAVGCKDDGSKASGSGGVRAADMAANAGAGSGTNDEVAHAEPAASTGTRPLATIAGAETRAWLARQKPGRLAPRAVPAEVTAELAELGRPLVDPGDRGAKPALRWAKVMSPEALAFAVGYADEADRRVVIVSVAMVAGGALVARSAQELRVDGDPDRAIRTAADVDADGDGVADTIVAYATGSSGGANSGLIVLGSKAGSTLDVQTSESESQSDADGDGDGQAARDWATDIQCWTSIGGRPVLLVGGHGVEPPSSDSDNSAPARWDVAAYAAGDDGVFAEQAISGESIATGPFATLEARRARDVRGDLRQTGVDEHEAPPCSEPPLIVPDGAGRYRLVRDLALGAPAPGSKRIPLAPLPEAAE